ncbi:MAG: hypothetical protein HKN23_20370 [Verrucomicrobiales bacterium]|nr:hypothetical protein [Verrucomicrobiales bacterium]
MARGDIKSRKLLIFKGILLLALGLLAGVLLILEFGPWWRKTILLAICVWAFCRAYYFAFYVITNYIDSEFKYAGLWSAVRYLLGKKS